MLLILLIAGCRNFDNLSLLGTSNIEGMIYTTANI